MIGEIWGCVCLVVGNSMVWGVGCFAGAVIATKWAKDLFVLYLSNGVATTVVKINIKINFVATLFVATLVSELKL